MLRNILLLMCAALTFIACKQEGSEKAEKPVAEQSTGYSMQLSSHPGWSNSSDTNPIPPNWRPIFRWVANAEVDSLSMIFSEGMYFSIQEMVSPSPEAAKARLAQFYRDNPPISFSYLHHGQSSSGIAQYAIGELATKSTNYRVTIAIQHGMIVSMDYELP